MAEYTLEEQDLLRDAITIAYATIANAQTNIFGRARERYAAVRAAREAPHSLDAIFAAGEEADDHRIPDVPLADALATAKVIVAEHQPEAVDDFVAFIVDMCEHVAMAAGGVSRREREVLDEVRAALG